MARDWQQRYLDIKTEDAGAHKYMGEIYEHLGKSEQAITCYQRSFTLNSKQSDLIKNSELRFISSFIDFLFVLLFQFADCFC